MMDQKSLSDYGFLEPEKKTRKNRYPIRDICISCGKKKVLNWISRGKHLCDECVKD